MRCVDRIARTAARHAVAALCLPVLFSSAATAQGFEDVPLDQSRHVFEHVASGMCLVASDAADGTRGAAAVRTCVDPDPVIDGCVSIGGPSLPGIPGAGTDCIAQDPLSITNELIWQFEFSQDSFLILATIGQCLYVEAGAEAAPGDVVEALPCGGGDRRLFELGDIQSLAPILEAALVHEASGLCLDVDRTAALRSGTLVLETCRPGGDGQIWKVTHAALIDDVYSGITAISGPGLPVEAKKAPVVEKPAPYSKFKK
ncbi:MAG: hypothetical protein AAF613_09215 [Pseudomonadota bacterium]